MGERVQVEKKTVEKREEPPQTDAKRVDTEAVKAEMDALLDEIDGVLEENAEEFVAQYIQAGGE